MTIAPIGTGKSEVCRVLLSSGADRIHFVETALALLDAGADPRLVVGWVPGPGSEKLANRLGALVGKPDLYRRLRVRTGGGRLEGRLHPMPLPEGLAHLAWHLGRRGLVPHAAMQALTWRLLGRASRRHVRDADVFHVRSGAGRGGAIRTARERGMRVVVDHSIAHPAWMDRELGPVYRSRGLPCPFGLDAFWRQVLEDCAEADVLLVNSDFVKSTFVEEGFDPARIAVAYLGVRDDFLGLKRDWSAGSPFRLLFTGAFVLRKGAHVLLDALALLEQAGVDCELTVAGSLDEAALLLAGRVLRRPPKLLGPRPQDELKALLAGSDAYVFPTLAEGCAKSAMEALAAGLPVVTTAACGLPARNGTEALVVEREDARGLADAVIRLATDGGLRESLGREGTRLVSTRYRWSNYAAELLRVYRGEGTRA